MTNINKNPGLIIYHNPRCSKSRQTLALIEEQGITPTIVLYLDSPPNMKTLKDILKKLEISAEKLVRKGEVLYKELELKGKDLTDNEFIKIMVEHPKLIERPIVVNGDKAIIGRPPENVLEII